MAASAKSILAQALKLSANQRAALWRASCSASIRFLLPARRELTEAVNYYNAQRARLGDEFRDEVWATLARIKKLPDSWHALSDSIRRCPTNRFPYGIIYTFVLRQHARHAALGI